MVSVLSCTEDGQTAGSSKESGTTSCFPEKKNGLVPVSHRLLSKSSYLVIKVACMDMMFLTPAFIRKTTGPAFLDQINHSLSVRLGFFRHKNSTPVFIWSEISTGTRRTEVKWS